MGPLEVAGLALAILPIVMAIADHKIGPPTPIFSRRAKKNKMVAFYIKLHDELTILTAVLRHLIQELPGISDPQKAQLLQLESDAWASVSIKDALRQRLEDGHEAFLDRLNSILKSLEDIISNKSADLVRADFTATTTSRPLYAKLRKLREARSLTSESLMNRFKFITREPKLRKSLAKITEATGFLERLLHRVPAGSDHQKRTKATSSVAPPRMIRELAGEVYKYLTPLLSCGCRTIHDVSLCMTVPCDTGASGSPVRFDMFILAGERNGTRRWQETSVHLSVDKAPQLQQQDSVQGRARFASPNPGQGASSGPRSPTSTGEGTQIGHFCPIVGTTYQNDTVFEMLLDHDALWHLQSSRRRVKLHRQQPSTTLGNVLKDTKRLSLRARRRLAVIFATALLHLEDSDWVEDAWTKNDVHFVSLTDGSTDLAKPFLSARSPGPARATQSGTGSSLLHVCPPLLDLGILILELGISEQLESRRVPDDLDDDGQPNANTNLTTAERVLEDSVNDLQVGYREAIEACLDPDFIDGTYDFNDDIFRGLVYQHVVKPLEDELSIGFNEKLEDFCGAG